MKDTLLPKSSESSEIVAQQSRTRSGRQPSGFTDLQGAAAVVDFVCEASLEDPLSNPEHAVDPGQPLVEVLGTAHGTGSKQFAGH